MLVRRVGELRYPKATYVTVATKKKVGVSAMMRASFTQTLAYTAVTPATTKPAVRPAMRRPISPISRMLAVPITTMVKR